MILAVTPNPALDMTYDVAGLQPGESHRVGPAAVRAGGKGVNVARILHQLGHPAHVLGPVGGAAGGEFSGMLEAAGMAATLIPTGAPTRRSVALVDTIDDRTTILNERGAALPAEAWGALREAAGQLATDARCVVGSGSLPPGAPAAFYADLVDIAHARGIPCVIDAVGDALLAAAAAGADVLKPNQRELVDSTGESDPLAGAWRLIEMGARLVVVSLGPDGLLAIPADASIAPLAARLPHALRGNPTGAGDAVVAAIAFELGRGNDDLGQILTRAICWAAAAVLSPVAGELSSTYDEWEGQVIVEAWVHRGVEPS